MLFQQFKFAYFYNTFNTFIRAKEANQKLCQSVYNLKTARTNYPFGFSKDHPWEKAMCEALSVVLFGNPLLDYIFVLKSTEILKKFNLEPDGQKETTQCEMEAILQEVKAQNYQCSVRPGGSALNTSRILQWLNGDKEFLTVFGSIGNDQNGIQLINIIENLKIKNRFATIDSHSTGWSLCLSYSNKRSLVANVDAAEHYNLIHLDETNKAILANASLIYLEGFFLTKRTEVIRFLVDFASEKNIFFAFNLSAVYIIETCLEDTLYVLKKSKLVFGNTEEYNALAEKLNVSGIEQIFLELDGSQILIVTEGSKAVRSYSRNGKTVCYIDKLQPEKIVDTTGCGDSFVAGFLHGYLQNKSIDHCIRWGAWTAQRIIGQLGCTPPSNVSHSKIYNVK